MRIKKLEISGFKSFAERTRLQFGDGITGVVGPNGCGKSNIVDAIRWCMGEMSAKHLRGRAMQDVIFAGSDSRGPQGMAEVTLTFHNDGDVPPSYLEYSEIAVTRRLFRDGTSEYHINKTPVRLRDVVDLFMGTGVGTRSYSIIEQGRIGFVINAKPEERRSLIEEVAGITKFKARKKMAERRMEATEANLLRVNDVVAELERQLGTLRRQARKAERYRELRHELRHLELHAAVLELMSLGAQRHVYTLSLQQAQSQVADTQAGMSADETCLEVVRLGLLEQEQKLQAMQQHSATLDTGVSTLERDAAHWQERAATLRLQSEQAAAEVLEDQALLLQGQQDSVRLSAQADEQERLVAYDADQIDAAQLSVDEGAQQLAAVDTQLEVLRHNAMQHVQGAAKQQAQVVSLERQRLEIDHRLERARRTIEQLQPQQSAAVVRRDALAQRQARLEAELTDLKARQAQLLERTPALKEATQLSHQQVLRERDLLGEKRSRLSSLQEIAQRMEGYSDGVRTLMHNPEHAVPGLLGLVTHLLEVAPAWEQAIEAALGERLQYLVVRQDATAVAAIARLKEKGGGRGGFIPQAVQSPAAHFTATGEGVIGPALQHVRVAPEYAQVAAYLLGHVVLVDTLATALARPLGPGEPWIYVSAAGEVVDGAGVSCGGSDNGSGLLANRREIRELHNTVQDQALRLQDAEVRFEAAEQARVEVESGLVQLAADRHRAELEALKVNKDHEAAQGDVVRFTERLAALSAEQQADDVTCRQLAEAQAAAAALARTAHTSTQEVQSALAELQERRMVQASQVAAHHEELTRLKVCVAAQAEKATAARGAVARLSGQLEQLSQRIARTQANQSATVHEAAQLEEKAIEATAAAAHKTLEAKTARQSVAQARVHYEAEQARALLLEQKLKEQRRGSETLQQTLVDCRMQLQKLDLQEQRLAEHILERHDVVLAEQVTALHMLPLPDAATQRLQQELERSIKSMGAINLTAIEECAEVETRFGFLSQQRDDLQQALEALRQAIGRINNTSKERFTEAFHAVNAMFQKVYPRLFRGGVARLELVRADDMLEAGVDIIAMPPGKKLQNVGLLSGGEKALTATALVFAIFLIKPSPFCILDEVDAPLDEANVGRFNEMLREISRISQFIVITHNKQSMLQADRLYGITMEEPGMSKVVSVDLSDEAQPQAA